QQLNAVRTQGVIPPSVPLDKALTYLEDQAKGILPQGFTVDYAGESRQLRVEGSKFLGTFLLSGVLIYLVLAAQFESFRDPFIILAGSVPLAISGALTFSFLGFTTLNIYSQVGLITLVGLISKHGRMCSCLWRAMRRKLKSPSRPRLSCKKTARALRPERPVRGPRQRQHRARSAADRR